MCQVKKEKKMLLFLKKMRYVFKVRLSYTKRFKLIIKLKKIYCSHRKSNFFFPDKIVTFYSYTFLCHPF